MSYISVKDLEEEKRKKAGSTVRKNYITPFEDTKADDLITGSIIADFDLNPNNTKAKEFANENSDFIETADRDTLSNYYRAYTDGINRAIERGDRVQFQKDRIMLDRISQKLGITSPLTFGEDFIKNVGYGITGAVTDTADWAAYKGISMTDQLNGDILFNIAKKNEGTMNDVFKNYQWGKENVERLTKLHEENPEDKDIEEIYNIVTKQGYKGDKEHINNLVSAINAKLNSQRYENWRDTAFGVGTRGVDLARENLNTQAQLGYNGAGRLALGAASTVSNMIPSIAISTATGGAAGLGLMATSAAGSATKSALDEGANWTQAGIYGDVVGATEAATELIGGETVNSLLFGRAISTPAGKVAKQIVDKLGLKSTISRGAVSGLLEVNAEGFEEMLSQALDPVYQSLILQKNDTWEDYGENIGRAYIESILPTLILGGLGKTQMAKEINIYGDAYKAAIQESKSLTDAQKGEMLKGWEKALKDAKAGFTENYTELKKTISEQLDEADLKNADTLTYAFGIAKDENMTDEQKRVAIQKYAREHGGIFNDSQATTQELKDTATTKNITYKDVGKIETALNDFRNKNANSNIELTTQINNVQDSIKTLLERLTGKQVVYVNPSSEDTKYYGFMNDDGSIYINSNLNAKDTLGAANHEIGHYVKTINPNLYNEFIKKANLTPDKIESYRKQVDDSLTDDQVKEEMFGDYIGEVMSKYKNTAAVEQSVTTLWDKIKRTAQTVGSTFSGNDVQGRVTDYNLEGLSYLEGDILNDAAFEQQVMDAFKSLKKQDQVEETTKETAETTKSIFKLVSVNSPGEAQENDVYDRIEQRYKDMKGKESPVAIKKMIANELGKEYNALNEDREVKRIYADLKDNGEITRTGVKFSAKKRNDEFKGKLHTFKYGDLASALNSDTPNLKNGIHQKPFKNTIYTIMKYGFDDYDILEKTPIDKSKLRKDKGVYRDEQKRRTNKNDGESRGRRGNNNLSSTNTEEQRKKYSEDVNDIEVRKEIANGRTMVSNKSDGDTRSRSSNGGIKLSSRKESNTERIINNQRNEIERQQEKIDNLETENKGLKKIIKGLKSTGRQQIKNVQSESNKMLKTGREQELKMKGQLERAGKKYNKLSEAAVDLKLERELERTAKKDGINFPREYKDLFIVLRRAGDSIKVAYATTKSIFDESQAVNKSIDNSISILKELRKNKIYNKLPNDIKAKINEYASIWAGSRKQSNLTLAKRVLNSLTARELRENGVNLTKSVRNQIMSEEGYGWENGKGSKSLQELFNGSKEVAQAFEQELVKLRQEVADFQARNFLAERTKQLEDTIIKMQDEVSNELGKQKKGFKKNVLKTNSTILNTLMTFKTEIQALMGGNGNTAIMQLNDNLQKGEVRKKQAVVEVYKILSEFMQRSKGLNYALNTERWSPTLEKSLSIKSKFADTGMSAYADNGKKIDIKLPRSMMMSLAMHLLNQDNMAHISGAATKITTDESGNTHIEYGKGKGIRIPDEAMFRAGHEKDAYDRGVTVRLTEEQVEGIANMLTDEEKAFVKAASEVFKYTSELINEVSNRIVGYDMATVENYFPIRVWDKGESKGSVLNAPMQKMYGDTLAHMLSPGWLQERTTSFNPIYLENIGEVLNRVVNNVTNFYGYAEALRDNHILLDSVMPDGTEFSKSIDNLSSSFMTNYNRLTRFITGMESLREGKFRRWMAMNTLTFNIGTWLTQPMSFLNTIKYFSGKEFLSSLSPTNNNVKLNKMIRNYFDEIGIDHTEYNHYQVARAFIAMATPNLENRAIGYKIPELSQLYNKNIENKLGAHGIEAFDNIAVTAIARMMAYSVSLDPNIKFGSEEYFDVLGERLTQVLVETQPEFSQVNRANMFRSSNPVLRMLSLFGTPANQMFNNFAQSTLQLIYEAREGRVSKNAITTLIKSASGIVLSSALVGLVRALRDSIRAGDDDDTEFVDKWLAQSIVSLLGPTLILDDVAQFVMGQTKYGGMSSYDFNTPETTFVNGFQNLGEKIIQLGKEDVSPAKKTRDIIRAIGVITPIDTKSMVRIVEALMKFITPDMYKAYSLQTDSTIYKQWLKNSDTDMATFYKAYTVTREKNLTNNYGYHKADKSKNIKSNLKEAREKALKDVLKNQKEVDKYMEILFNYKK